MYLKQAKIDAVTAGSSDQLPWIILVARASLIVKSLDRCG